MKAIDYIPVTKIEGQSTTFYLYLQTEEPKIKVELSKPNLELPYKQSHE